MDVFASLLEDIGQNRTEDNEMAIMRDFNERTGTMQKLIYRHKYLKLDRLNERTKTLK